MNDQTLDETLKKQFSNQPAENYRALTFGELHVGDKLIVLPIPGDNSGHGGFAQPHHIWEKTEKLVYGSSDFYNNAVRGKDGVRTAFHDGVFVIKVE